MLTTFEENGKKHKYIGNKEILLVGQFEPKPCGISQTINLFSLFRVIVIKDKQPKMAKNDPKKKSKFVFLTKTKI